MSKTTSTSRKQRRAYELWLKKNNPSAYADWKSNRLERSATLISQQEEMIRERETKTLETVQANLINKWESEGKSKEEVERLSNIWALTIKPWGSDEKKLSWKEAEKLFDLENTK